jgi:hypothetical protein
MCAQILLAGQSSAIRRRGGLPALADDKSARLAVKQVSPGKKCEDLRNQRRVFATLAPEASSVEQVSPSAERDASKARVSAVPPVDKPTRTSRTTII